MDGENNLPCLDKMGPHYINSVSYLRNSALKNKSNKQRWYRAYAPFISPFLIFKEKLYEKNVVRN